MTEKLNAVDLAGEMDCPRDSSLNPVAYDIPEEFT